MRKSKGWQKNDELNNHTNEKEKEKESCLAHSIVSKLPRREENWREASKQAHTATTAAEEKQQQTKEEQGTKQRAILALPLISLHSNNNNNNNNIGSSCSAELVSIDRSFWLLQW
jgi:hypothetical protein